MKNSSQRKLKFYIQAIRLYQKIYIFHLSFYQCENRNIIAHLHHSSDINVFIHSFYLKRHTGWTKKGIKREGNNLKWLHIKHPLSTRICSNKCHLNVYKKSVMRQMRDFFALLLLFKSKIHVTITDCSACHLKCSSITCFLNYFATE